MSFRESILSIGSRMAHKHDDIHFDVMTDEELQQMQDDLLQRIWMVSLENDVYERYLMRHDPQSIKKISNLLERAKFARRVTAYIMPRSSRMSFRDSIMALHDPGKHSITSVTSNVSIHSGSRLGTGSMLTVGTSGETTKITISHRITMARKEVEEMRKVLENFRETTLKKKTYLRAEIEELEIRIGEAQEAREEFEEEVVEKGVNRITGKIPAERIIRFVEEWLRSANTIIERLRLKSATLRAQIKKAEQQLIQREELGESLHVVDFEQLNIENQDYVKMIEEKNRYVIEMKRIAGHYHLKLTQRKQRLDNLITTLNEVKKEIAMKQGQIKKLEAELKIVQVKVKQKNGKLKNLLTFMENHTAPDILDFVYLQAEFQGLEKSFKRLQRRRDIDRIIYQTYKKLIHKKTHTSLDYKYPQTKKISDTRYPVLPIF